MSSLQAHTFVVINGKMKDASEDINNVRSRDLELVLAYWRIILEVRLGRVRGGRAYSALVGISGSSSYRADVTFI